MNTFRFTRGGLPSLIVLVAVWQISIVSAQAQISNAQKPVTIDFKGEPITSALNQLRNACQCPIYLAPNTDTLLQLHGTFEAKPPIEILAELLGQTNFAFMTYQHQVIIVGDRETIEQEFTAQYYQALEESIEVAHDEKTMTEVVGDLSSVSGSGQMILNGKVIDGETGERVIGATLLIQETSHGTATDETGTYEIPLRPGDYTLTVQYIGYRKREIPIKVIGSGSLDIEIVKGSILLDEVVVEAQKRDENVQSVQAGVTRLRTREIEKLPSFLGEVDVLKSLLLQPGVSSIGEGSSGFNVRGGDVDQNLILIDEAMLFNSSHALGFFSAFNSDIVSDATLYKANIPAKYGGRLSSVLEVNVKDGNFERLHFKGGLGVVSSRFTLEGPLKANQTSFLISGRSTYSDWLLGAINVPELKASSAFFYDSNLRITHRFDDRNFVSLSAYISEDDFTFNDQFGFQYQTSLGQLTYQRLFGNNLLSTLSAVWGEYDSSQEELRPLFASNLRIGTRYWKFKENLSLEKNVLKLDGGVSAILYEVSPGQLEAVGSESLIRPKMVEDENGIEAAAYLLAAYDLSPRTTVEAGLRVVHYQYRGPREMNVYEDPARPREENILGRMIFEGSSIYSSARIEPRLSARHKLSPESSLKIGYSRTSQFINQISNTDTPTPTNVWKLSDQYIPGQLSHNFSLGYFRNFKQNIYITSVDVFYRYMDELFDYKDFADLVANDHLETELRRGIGRSRGLELSIKKQVGYIHGWINYTYSRSERKVAQVNEGRWYPAVFDKPHDLSLVANIQVNKRNTISINFNYSTGRPITIPTDRYLLENQFSVLNYSQRNAFRIPNYHRLDFAYTLGQGFKKSRKFKTSWTFSVYNLYGRRNPFSVFLEQVTLGEPRVRRLSVLGSAFPSLTFNFELL